MEQLYEIEYLDVEKGEVDENLIEKVISKCFEIEQLSPLQFYISLILTNPENIRKYNKEYRNIDKETDVLSFPMFEKDEIREVELIQQEVLGDIIISIERVREQAIEYGHSFERELAYMLVHGFYHIMGEDHMQEDEKKQMRAKEEKVLQALNIER